MRNTIKKIFMVIVVTLAFVLGCVACSNEENSSSDASKKDVFAISATTVELDLFESGRQLNAKYNDETVVASWSSSAEQAVAVVDGLITPVREGTAIITASYNGQSATCKVIVKMNEQRPTIWVSSSTCDLITDGKVTVSAEIRYGNEVLDSALSLTVDGSEFITAEWKEGKILVQGIKAGSGTITVSGTCRGFVLTPVVIMASVIA